VSIIERMVIDMNETQVRTLEQVRQVLLGTEALQFRRPEDEEGRYAWIESVLKRFAYRWTASSRMAGMLPHEGMRPRDGD
jgi:hypothetical protein